MNSLTDRTVERQLQEKKCLGCPNFGSGGALLLSDCAMATPFGFEEELASLLQSVAMKADVLVVDPRFGGQNWQSVARSGQSDGHATEPAY